MTKIGVFAGVFDPVHNGHVAIVQKALAEGLVDRVVIVSEKVPIHKKQASSYQDRHAMLELAFVDVNGAEVLESPLLDHYIKPFFTWLNNRFGAQQFVWMVGSDVVAHMQAWPDIAILPELNVVEIVAFGRGQDTAPTTDLPIPVRYIKESAQNAHISSSIIRQNVHEYKAYLPETVYQYVQQKELYKPN